LQENELLRTKEEIFDIYGIPPHHHQFMLAIKRVPWKILPFIIIFFILIQALNSYGVVDFLANILSNNSKTLFSSIFSNGITSFILANIINNQPMTILFSSVFINDNFILTKDAFIGGAYSVVIASNLGANLTIIGSLAGLMWKKILKTKDIDINYLDFLKIGLSISIAVFILTLLSLYLVLLIK